MRNNMFKKGLVLGIIVLFIGASIIPSIGGNLGSNNIKDDSIEIDKETNINIDKLRDYSRITDWWPMFHHDVQHIGFSTATAPESNNTLWTYPTGEDVFTSPAVYDGKVYIGSWDKKLYCLYASNGTHIWNTTINFLSLSSPAVYEDKVYIGGLRVYCLDASTGVILHESTEGYFFDSSPAISYGKLYIGSENDEKIFCFSATNLEHIWNYSTGRITLSSPAIYDGKIYIGSMDHKIYCLNAFTGEPIWNYETADVVFSSPTLFNGKVYVGSDDGNLYCLSATDGSLIWMYTATFGIRNTPAMGYGNVYFGCHPRIFCVDAETGNHIWSYSEEIIGWFDSSLAVADEKVYIGSYKDGSYNKLYCLNAYNGKVIWDYSFYGGTRSSPAVVNGTVFIGANDDYIYAFKDSAEPVLCCNGSLYWSDVKPVEPLIGSFEIRNCGEAGTELSWEVTEWPDWGDDWAFSPAYGIDLTPEDGPITVEVEVVAPPDENTVFNGEVKVVDSDNPCNNCTIPIYLKTPRNKAINKPLLNFLQNLPNLFPKLQMLLQRI